MSSALSYRFIIVQQNQYKDVYEVEVVMLFLDYLKLVRCTYACVAFALSFLMLNDIRSFPLE